MVQRKFEVTLSLRDAEKVKADLQRLGQVGQPHCP